MENSRKRLIGAVAFMLAFHRLLTYALIMLVMMHIYASFIFKLVTSMITGRRNERVALPSVVPVTTDEK